MVFVFCNYSVLENKSFSSYSGDYFSSVRSTQMPRFKWFKICYMQLIESEQSKKTKTNWNVSELCVVCLSIAPAKCSFFSENSVTDHIFLVHRRAELLILAKQSTITERYISNTACKAF